MPRKSNDQPKAEERKRVPKPKAEGIGKKVISNICVKTPRPKKHYVLLRYNPEDDKMEIFCNHI